MNTKLINEILNEMQETLNLLQKVNTEQKNCILQIIKNQEDEKRNEKKIKEDYRNNIENYIKYNQLKTINDLDKMKVKENDKLFKEQIQHSKKMIDEFHKNKYHKKIINNLEDFVSI